MLTGIWLMGRCCCDRTMPEDHGPSAALAWRARMAYYAACLALSLVATNPAAAFQLITAAESALPPGTVPSFEVRGSPTRLPSIAVVSPAGMGTLYSPVNVKLRFTAFGGAAIDPETVVVIYVKQPDIDITPRLKSFITANGIEISQADVPPGLHQFWVQLKDTEGRTNGREFDFQVAK
jgi:hypothetical protein